MALIGSVQVTTNLGKVTNEQILALAEAHGMDAGEYRRHLLVKAADAALADFRAAYGMSPQEWLAELKSDRTTPTTSDKTP
jgi:hypothetical protein